jgi:hypothetical protein
VLIGDNDGSANYLDYPVSGEQCLHYDDTDIKIGFVHGYHVNKEHTIELLRLYGADEISVIVKDNNPDIPALRRVQELCDAGYTYISTSIEGPMTYRLRRITTD